ncbi:thioredoxin reductase-like selenoprotein T homolog CG3887 [Cephus cinctus]|uniref:Thioredoxin reductase-like selenoprotein T homolog CG3887 n=1 Tax=Cephus cinctus TaxID=211228 RepID=A0AAJ7FTP4_CEPCN|nr:thioredoxin reductase-like selenoprotein T homolog CG3887 [Cephus cinctus]
MRVFTLSLCLFVLLCALTCKVNAIEKVKEAPLTKLGAQAGPTLKFFYCYSCGYRKMFEEYVGILRQKYPELQVVGENFNPPGYNMLLARFLFAAKIIIIVLILSGINISEWIGQPTPSWWQWCMANRIFACLMLFVLSNAIEGMLVASGAFEIHFNDVPVWSKLETGRVPQPPELFQIIDNHIRFQKLDTDNIDFNK